MFEQKMLDLGRAIYMTLSLTLTPYFLPSLRKKLEDHAIDNVM